MLRQSEKYPGCGLCDSCKIRYKLPKEDEDEDEDEKVVEPVKPPKRKDDICWGRVLISLIIFIHLIFWVLALYCLR